MDFKEFMLEKACGYGLQADNKMACMAKERDMLIAENTQLKQKLNQVLAAAAPTTEGPHEAGQQEQRRTTGVPIDIAVPASDIRDILQKAKPTSTGRGRSDNGGAG